ncbi:MAG: right-handed parallel beta-helix repeat-containing protein [Verrucomicrobiia bacterium]
MIYKSSNPLTTHLLIATVVVALLFSPTSSALSAGETATIVHVSAKGDDGNPGTAEKPVATVQHAVQLVDKAGGTGEVVIHGGRYYTRVDLQNPKMPEGQPVPPLVIRAAAGEEVFFDGSIPLTGATPLPDSPGVYTVEGQFPLGTPPSIWEPATRTRYLVVADLAAVRQFNATCTLSDPKTCAFRTSDGGPPGANKALRSSHLFGIFIQRNNVTVRGIHFENYLGWSYACGVCNQSAKNVTIESCTAANCVRGFIVGPGGAEDTTFRDCEAHDVGGGLYSNGKNTIVERCRFTKVRDGFEIDQGNAQDDAGIQLYSPASAGAVRFNFVRGFHHGIFVKAGGATYFVEHNTLVDVADGLFNNTWASGDPSQFCRNVIVDAQAALLYPPAKGFPKGAAFDHNLAWSETHRTSLEQNLAEVRRAGSGANNQHADPKCADAEHGDYRLLTNSPAIALGQNGVPAGAFGVVPADYVCANPPTLRVQTRPPITPGGAYGKLFFDRDPWIGGGREFVKELSANTEATALLTPNRDLTLTLTARHPTSAIVKVKTQVDDQPAVEAGFKPEITVQLPDTDGLYRVKVSAQNAAGQWSEPVTLPIALARAAPRLVSAPRVSTSRYGAIVVFETDRPAVARALASDAGTPLPAPDSNRVVERQYDSNAGGMHTREWTVPSLRHAVAIAEPGMKPGATYSYRIEVADPIGNKTVGGEGKFTTEGRARVLHVAMNGADAEDGGSVKKPWKTLQFALDRALPGDTVRIAPGLYHDSARLFRGGRPAAPITIEAADPNTVTLDGLKRVPHLIQLLDAPHVVIRNLNVRWFTSSGIHIDRSPYARIERCRFINQAWDNNFCTGSGVAAYHSPHGTFTHNIAARMEVGIYLQRSPEASVTHNSTTDMMYGGLGVIYSCRNTVVKNNAFCFTGNDSVYILEDNAADFRSMQMDYNNHACNVAAIPRKMPLKPFLRDGSKAIIQATVQGYESSVKLTFEDRLLTMEDWRKFSGKDEHSIFADPNWINPIAGRWDVEKDSPNIGAGENGATIGAIGYVGDLK